MSKKQLHKELRKSFNEQCLSRDKHKCVFCNERKNLDVHHIVDRHEMPNGGYAPSNGITVCATHHRDCEQFHETGIDKDGFSQYDLFKKIGSCYDQAFEDCLNLIKGSYQLFLG